MDDSKQSVDVLLSRVRDRDAAAAEALVNALYPVVVQVVERRRPRQIDAADIAQDVFLRFFQNLDRFRGGARELEAWMRRTAFRACLDHHRRQKSRPELRWADLSEEQMAAIEGIDSNSHSPSPAERTGARDLLDLLLSRLPSKERMLVEMVDIEQCETQDVIATTGWSAVNVRVRLFRARRKLRTLLANLADRHE